MTENLNKLIRWMLIYIRKDNEPRNGECDYRAVIKFQNPIEKFSLV